ncbi:SPFH domain-containing protein [Gammaproteobacteria bacterium]|nr:SPFH domain-containing protein [Gammaproteobacteria bacterium]
MSLWDRLTGEFIDVISWEDDRGDRMAWRFERHDAAIKYGAQLTVREGQVAVFVNEGRIADVFQPGQYTLETNNLPLLTTLQAWPFGFSSPFKADVVFFSTRQFTDLKWGTKNPVMLRDPEFGPLRLRAFGSYAIRIEDPVIFMREVTGVGSDFVTDEISDHLRNIIVSRFSSQLGESKIPVLDLAANYDDLSEFLEKRLKPELLAYGLATPKFIVENISLPPAVEQALDKRTSMGIVGDLRKYTQFQAAEAMGDAANNPDGGGVAAMGVGFGMANMLSQTLAESSKQLAAGSASPPPLPRHDTLQVYIAVNGAQSGPFSIKELEGKRDGGQLTGETLVWMSSFSDWQSASDVPFIAQLLNRPQVPPPLPTSS